MNLRIAHILAAATLAPALFAADAAATFKDQKEKFSYSVGMNLANSWKRQSIDVDPDTLAKGIKDALAGKTALTEAEAREVLMAFQKEMSSKREEQRKVAGEENKKKGEAFLAENKGKPGVVTTASGLQYKVLTEGSGDAPKLNDTVTVDYKGTLLDGTEFDSSYKRGQPATFSCSGVIKGWQEALQLMKPGAKYQLWIPSDLAYGPNGSGATIGPNSVLSFEVDLKAVKPAPAATGAKAEPVTSDIIKVPSEAEMKAGAKIEVIKASEVEKLKAAEKEKADKAAAEKK